MDIVQANDAGVCAAIVTWNEPTASDNCTTVTLDSDHDSGDSFPVGITTVTYTATDSTGNTITCSFDIRVNDEENPTFTFCPSDITVSNLSLIHI